MNNAIIKFLFHTSLIILKVVDFVTICLGFSLLLCAGYQILGAGHLFVGFSMAMFGAASVTISNIVSNAVFYRELMVDRN